MKLNYDAEADILYIDFVERHEGQVTREIGDGLLAEVNLANGATEGLEVWNFRRPATGFAGMDVPVSVQGAMPAPAVRAS